MAKKNSFSLTVTVMVFALIAIFVGYFIGNWVIQMAVESPEKEVAQESKSQVDTKSQDDNNTTVEIDSKEKSTSTDGESNKKNIESFTSDGYAVQVGAFNNFENALSLKQELKAEGFNVIITGGKPHKVRIGPFNGKKEAEKIQNKVESIGYNGYVMSLKN